MFMVKPSLNAVYYSKGNIEKAYLIKNLLWKSKFQVTNISNFSELVYAIQQQEVNLLIVDGETIKITEEFLDITKNYKFAIPDNIFFINYTSNIDMLEINNENRFLVTYSNFSSVFNENQHRLIYNIERNKSNKFNSNFINMYLTQFLIRLGFLPKHVGFNYIKQCIEEALCHNGILGSLSTEIYPCVARRNGTTPINIERNIRNSIECANKISGNKEEVLKDVFHKEKCVSNRAFLSYLLDQVLISYEQMERNYSVL